MVCCFVYTGQEALLKLFFRIQEEEVKGRRAWHWPLGSFKFQVTEKAHGHSLPFLPFLLLPQTLLTGQRKEGNWELWKKRSRLPAKFTDQVLRKSSHIFMSLRKNHCFTCTQFCSDQLHQVFPDTT